MKKTFLLSIMFLVAVLFNASAQRIKGSDTLLPLSQKLAEIFMSNNSGSNITITGGGSGVGISSLIDGTTDICQSSRKMKFEEMQKLKDLNKDYKEVIIAYDALSVIVNSENKVKNLTREQLEGIFTGKIKNWKEVGGDDMAIVPYSRETSSGTYEFFQNHVLNKKNFMNGIMSMPATGAIIQSVSQTKGAIGYVGLAYLNKSVKAIDVSFDNKNFVEPSLETAKNKTYPIIRPLYYYYLQKDEKMVKSFVDYALSEEGQKTVLEIGFIPL